MMNGLAERNSRAGMPDHDVRFTVIVTTYNYAHLLPDALRTVAAQTVQDFELLVVDDGSTDNTEEVVARFQPQFRDCRYLKKTHSGPADTRNFAVRAALGTHIAFLDADDLWSPHYLRTVGEAFKASPEADMVLFEGITFWSENRTITDIALIEGIPPMRGPARAARDIFSILRVLSPSGMVFLKTLYDQAGPFDTEIFGWFGEDLDWTLRALLAGAFCVCSNRRPYLYRRHDANLTNKAANSFRAWLSIYSQTLGENRVDPELKALVRGMIRSHSVRFLTTCSNREARVLLRLGIETLGGDVRIRLCYLGTYLGLAGLLKFLKQFKQFGRGLFRRKLAIDLGASPEVIFDALPKCSYAPGHRCKERDM